MMTDLAKKLQIPQGEKIRVLEAPRGMRLDLPTTRSKRARALMLFARDKKVLKAKGAPLVEAAREDRLTWICYPKAGQLETDLDRDTLARMLGPHGVRPVRQIAVDEIWSAMRFRPAGGR